MKTKLSNSVHDAPWVDYTHVPTYNIEGIENIYGSYYIQFDELSSGDWLISFKSESILQSKHLKMTKEEMDKVLARKINY